MSNKIEIKKVYSGISFGGLLTIAFIVLKLCKVIAWNWLWVLSPLWIPLALVLSTLVLIIITAVVVKNLKK